MQKRIEQLQKIPKYRKVLQTTCRKNNLSITLLNGLTIRKLKAIYNRTLNHYRNNQQKAKIHWFENELRLFHWTLIIQSYFNQILLIQFVFSILYKNQKQWTLFQIYFPAKSSPIFNYELKKLIYSKNNDTFHPWTNEQSNLLQSILKQINQQNAQKPPIYQWNHISRQFYERSDRNFFKTGKQCRQQWFNHLDKSKKHGQWGQLDDRAILEYVKQKGHKWAKLRKNFLAQRTEHMIKNRFRSLILKAKMLFPQSKNNQKKLIKKMLNYLAKQSHNVFSSAKVQFLQEDLQKIQEDQIMQENELLLQNLEGESFENQINMNQINNINNSDKPIHHNSPLILQQLIKIEEENQNQNIKQKEQQLIQIHKTQNITYPIMLQTINTHVYINNEKKQIYGTPMFYYPKI